MQNANRVRIAIQQQYSKETHKYNGTTRVRTNKKNEEYTLISFPNPTPTVNMVYWTQIEPLNHAPPVKCASEKFIKREKNSPSSPLQSGIATSCRNFPRAVDKLLQPLTPCFNCSNFPRAVDELLQPMTPCSNCSSTSEIIINTGNNFCSTGNGWPLTVLLS